jgi:hypothetical protein
MKEHPFQYWALVSVALALGGLGGVIKVIVLGRGNLAVGVTIFLLGLAVGLAVVIQSRRKLG